MGIRSTNCSESQIRTDTEQTDMKMKNALVGHFEAREFLVAAFCFIAVAAISLAFLRQPSKHKQLNTKSEAKVDQIRTQSS
ncbi:hypothetical protein LguiA_035267 [Lonicera macranthoides]